MIDGMRFPGQGNGQCVVDPSIIPALSIDHIDVLVDGASATYGSDAVGGVINIILKRTWTAPSPRRAGPQPRTARTATSPPRSGAAPGTAAR